MNCPHPTPSPANGRGGGKRVKVRFHCIDAARFAAMFMEPTCRFAQVGYTCQLSRLESPVQKHLVRRSASIGSSDQIVAADRAFPQKRGTGPREVRQECLTYWMDAALRLNSPLERGGSCPTHEDTRRGVSVTLEFAVEASHQHTSWDDPKIKPGHPVTDAPGDQLMNATRVAASCISLFTSCAGCRSARKDVGNQIDDV